jgi:hypothetical protein
VIVQGYDRRSSLVLLGLGLDVEESGGSAVIRFPFLVPLEVRVSLVDVIYRGVSPEGHRYVAVDSLGRQVAFTADSRDAGIVARQAELLIDPATRTVQALARDSAVRVDSEAVSGVVSAAPTAIVVQGEARGVGVAR